MDGKLVGGDTGAQLQYPDPQEAKDWYREGPFQFFLRKGLPSYGLPFAIAMTFVNGQGSLEGNLVAFTINLVGFGGAMEYFHWRSIKKEAEERKG